MGIIESVLGEGYSRDGRLQEGVLVQDYCERSGGAS